MNGTVVRLTARSLLGRRRALLLLGLPVILLLLSAFSRAVGGQSDGTTGGILAGFTLGTVIPLLGLIAGTGAIGPEIDDGSIVYLLSKPLSRFSIVTSKVSVAIAVVVAFGVVPTLITGLVLTGTSGNIAIAFAVGALAAGIAYSALFLLLAVITRQAVVVGLLYALVWESLVGTFVPGARSLSIQKWGLSLTEKMVGTRADALNVDAAVGVGTGVTLLVIVTVASTWYAGWRLRSLRLTSDD